VRRLLTGLLLVAFAMPAGAAETSRDPAVAREFERQKPCPSTGRTSGPCPGYVRDHIVPLACGGADAVSNMQWQTTEEAKAKDKVELECQTRPVPSGVIVMRGHQIRPVPRRTVESGVTVLRGR